MSGASLPFASDPPLHTPHHARHPGRVYAVAAVSLVAIFALGAKFTTASMTAAEAGRDAEARFTYQVWPAKDQARYEDSVTKACEKKTGRGADDRPQYNGNVPAVSETFDQVMNADRLAVWRTCRDVGYVMGFKKRADYEDGAAQARQAFGDAARRKAFFGKMFSPGF